MTPQERRNWTGPILEIYADIESWRDWHWRQFLSDMTDYRNTDNPLFLQYANDSRQRSMEYHRILEMMTDSSPAPQVIGRWKDYKYGDFPEDYK